MRSQKFDLARLIAGVLTRIVFPVYRWWYFRNDRRQSKLIQSQTAKLRRLNASVTEDKPALCSPINDAKWLKQPPVAKTISWYKKLPVVGSKHPDCFMDEDMQGATIKCLTCTSKIACFSGSNQILSQKKAILDSWSAHTEKYPNGTTLSIRPG